MNVNLLQISLFIVCLAVASASLPVQAFCAQKELCEAQKAVDELLEEIVGQHEAIGEQWDTLGSLNGWNSLPEWYDRAIRFMDVVSRYLRIGTLESQLLVASNRLGSVQVELNAYAPGCHCGEKIQLSAGL